jgi:KipI family sensor histidine kinase inhibitor
MSTVLIEPLGDSALLIRLGDSIDARTNSLALALAGALREAKLPGVCDIAPAYASVGVRFDIDAMAGSGVGASPNEFLAHQLHRIVEALSRETLPLSPDTIRGEDGPEWAESTSGLDSARLADGIMEIPVCYGGDFGPDLEALAAHTQLEASEVIARHVRAEYRVAMLGFMPGFPYLLGLDKALHAPRRASPRTRVPAGSVAIGGAQTGIYPRELPGGWQLIGRTPLMLFDAARAPPALLRPGQRVCFRAIEAGEFAALAQ